VDLTPPSTAIDSGPDGTTGSTAAVFGFFSNDVGATFRCRLDGAAFAACTSPKGYENLGDGQHVFNVVAVDLAGNEDPTPATRTWTVATGSPTPTATATASAEPTVTATATTTAEPTPTPTPTATPDPGDHTPPTLTIVKKPRKVVKSKRVKIVFRADEPASFTCKVDRKKAKPCSSPLKAKVKRGTHKIGIRATDIAGNRSGAMTVRFRVR
jgi:hypothetical protein